jgi:predicted amidohydrolase YtcJ
VKGFAKGICVRPILSRALVFTLLLAQEMTFAQNSPTLLLLNGKIWTCNPKQAEAEAIAIGDGRLLAVGSTAEIAKLQGKGTRVVDLLGKRVLPGFNDAHVHFFEGGANLTAPPLRFSRSPEDFRDTLAAFARHLPKGHWIQGGNWDHESWSPAHLPTRQLIDPVTQDWPVFVNRLDGHMSLANSPALKLAGINKNTADVPGGVIVRDAEGVPTGILKDAAQDLVIKVIPPPSPSQIRDTIRASQVYANSQGVTSVQDMSATPDVLRVYQTMLHDRELHVRISGHQPLASWHRLAIIGIVADFGNDFLHIGALKGFADGSLGSTTALFFRPYLDAPGTNGIASAELADPDQMWESIRSADAAGLQIAIHAIGDKANNTILNIYERLEREHGERDRRLRIEHAQHLLPADIPRFGTLHVIASMQPYHCIDDGRWAEKRIGSARAETSYAFRSLLDSRATLAFGSDWPVAPMSPLMGIYAAVTRRTLDGKNPDGWVPRQKITVEKAVQAYTMGSAFASFDEINRGSIEIGKLADLVVLSDDIFSIEPIKIPDVKVEATIVGGNIIAGALPVPRDSSGLILR